LNIPLNLNSEGFEDLRNTIIKNVLVDIFDEVMDSESGSE
jgi:hypothetical protein